MYSIGTEGYIRRVVEEYSSMLLRLAMTRLNCTADAEDAVQEVFLRLLTTRPRFRDGDHERAWLIRATIHRAPRPVYHPSGPRQGRPRRCRAA